MLFNFNTLFKYMQEGKQMKGIILAGGKATRLMPCTSITSKQLLPVYNRPMIYYPLNTLIKAGIKDILIIIAPDYAGQFLNLLSHDEIFEKLGVKFEYKIQKDPRGLPDAFVLGETFIDDDNVALILGDNIFEDDLSEAISSFQSGGRIFAKKVPDPKRFGVVEFDENKKAISIEEKPEQPKSNYAAVGLYIYDNSVIEVAKNLKPSVRGEIEICDLHNWYLEKGELDVREINGVWYDAGTFDSLMEASNYVAQKHKDGKNILDVLTKE
jgi:glucose-1-phosphate thymidylyltransferase